MKTALTVDKVRDIGFEKSKEDFTWKMRIGKFWFVWNSRTRYIRVNGNQLRTVHTKERLEQIISSIAGTS